MKKLLLAATLMLAVSVPQSFSQVNHEVMLEQFTTEKCPQCPGGTARIKSVVASMVDQVSVSWISHHAGFGTDFLTLSESTKLLRLFQIGRVPGTPQNPTGYYGFAPGVAVNRALYQSIVVDGVSLNGSNIKSRILHVLDKLKNEQKAFVNLSETDMTYDVESRVLKLRITAGKLPGFEDDDNFYLNAALTENKIEAEHQNGAGENYIHNNVLRKLLGGAEGVKVDPNNASAEWEFKIPDSWKIEDMRVIIFAHRSIGKSGSMPKDVSVFDSKEYPFPHTGTSISSVADQNMKVYATNGQLVIEGDYLSAKVYDLNGRLMPKARLNAGVYVVSVETHTGVYNHKVVVD